MLSAVGCAQVMAGLYDLANISNSMILYSRSVTKELYPKVDLNFRLVTNKTSESRDVHLVPLFFLSRLNTRHY